MKTIDQFRKRSARRRLQASLGLVALGLGVVSMTPIAQANGAAAHGKGTPTDQSQASSSDFASGKVRTKPGKDKKATEAAPAATPAQLQAANEKKKEPEADAGGDNIVGGTTAAAGAYPFYTALKFNGNTSSFCGGTLVSSVWVLTAAHCVDGSVTASQLKLVIGANQWGNEAAGDTRSVTSINIHPSWNASSFDNDIALLRLNAASTKKWARFAEPADPVNPGNTVRAVGHGATSEGGSQSADLLQVDLPIQSDATMSDPAQYGSSFHGGVMIGAGPLAGGQDTCQGDSGGPLFIPGGDQVRLVGDVSWGTGCARPNKPGIYGEVYQGALRSFANGLISRPGNDNFAGSGISGAEGTVSGNNTDATGQPGEPSIGGSNADTTVWYSWTAPENGPTSFNLRDAAFDTTLGVFTGNSFPLTSIAQNDDFNGTSQSKVTFNAVAGTTYRIAVDGWAAAFGPFSLQWAQNSPANDNFSSAIALDTATGKAYTNTARSTGEPGEPTNYGSIPDRSVWYSWTAPESGPAVFNTRESNFDTVLGVYTGSSITGLSLVTSNDDFNGTSRSKVFFNAVAGTTYKIVVDGFGAAVGDLGLQWSTNPPANDNFGAAQALPGQYGSVSSTSVRATGEPGELDYHGGAIADNSVWFSWTPTVSAPANVSLSNVGGGLAPGIQVYTGTSLGALTTVLDGGSVGGDFNVTAGTTYLIAVDGNGGSTGTFDLGYAAYTVPGTPTVTNSTPSPGSVSVEFDPPANTGGSAITSYIAHCVSTNGGVNRTASGTGSPISVYNLSASKRYQCRVRAFNATGGGSYSAYGTEVRVPGAAVPTPPAVTSSTPSAGAVTVAFDAPLNNGGSPVTSYTAHCSSTNGGISKTATGTSSPITVNNLSATKDYQCRVRAFNAAGGSAYGAYGSLVTLPAAVVPGTPTVTAEAVSAGAISVSFTAPDNNGGSPITSYTAHCSSTNGGASKTANGTTSPISVTALTAGKDYHCRVRAFNSVGGGAYGAYGPTVTVP